MLDYRQAQDKAREWLATVEGGVAVKANYTVGSALDDYLKAFTKKDLANTKRRVEQFVRPALGDVKLSRSTIAQVDRRPPGQHPPGFGPRRVTSRSFAHSMMPSCGGGACPLPIVTSRC